jgi:hypothetical protein
MKEIQLTQGMITWVDDADYLKYSKYKYVFNGRYAYRSENKKTIYLHREIMQTPPGMDTDHINRNTLDNRKNNLRVCTHAENCKNNKKKGTYGFH